MRTITYSKTKFIPDTVSDCDSMEICDDCAYYSNDACKHRPVLIDMES